MLQLDSITVDSYRKLFSNPFGYGQSPFNWATVEVKVTDEEKKAQIKKNMRWVLEENIDSAFLSRVHIMDINNDKMNDFIYTGWGAAQYLTQIFIAGENDTTRFNNFSFVADLEMTNQKVNRLYFQTTLASGGPAILGYSIVDISYGRDSITFVQRFDCQNVNVDSFPKKYSLFDIESLSDSLIVRSEPVALDTPTNYVLELPGNQLGKVPKGTKATVIGNKLDTLGNNWYFALIWPQYKIKDYVYCCAPENAYTMVWVDSEGWRRINK